MRRMTMYGINLHADKVTEVSHREYYKEDQFIYCPYYHNYMHTEVVFTNVIMSQ